MEVEIPEPQRVNLDARKTAVIVVDMQNDFADPKGSLFVKTAPDTIPAISRVLEKAREAGVKIIYTQDWHSGDDPEFKIWGVHALAGTWGAEVVDALKPREDDIIVKKLRYDAFYGTSLEHILRLHKIETLVVTGTVANICVLHTAGSAALRWFNVVVPVDCISAITEFDYKAALRQITFLYRGTLTKSDLISFT
ncbi:MAG TPA: cysteine hydrolase [Aigarchaeota archaeon]|nr:cysteine hydrolase [Aigarchaeota archaeon]